MWNVGHSPIIIRTKKSFKLREKNALNWTWTNFRFRETMLWEAHEAGKDLMDEN